MNIILGIDPGIDRVGFGLIRHKALGEVEYLDSGVIHTSKYLTMGQRLSMVRQDLCILEDIVMARRLILVRGFSKN